MIDETLLDLCEQEQLHLSNAIQDFGALIAIDEAEVIQSISTNAATYVPGATKDALGKNIKDLLGEHFDPVSNVTLKRFDRSYIFGYRLPNKLIFDIMIAPAGNYKIIELQPAEVGQVSRVNGQIGLATHVMEYSHPNGDDPEFYHYVCKAIQDITGFEKIMIYQFQEDWSGAVIAESNLGESFPNYFGLRFPADDIPKIARDLYTKAPYRLICDVAAEPAHLISKTSTQIDLTLSDLRSVSPVHIEYLKNMDVGASLSFPIVLNDELWGLFALHHPKKKYLSIDSRLQCFELSYTFAMTQKARQSARRMKEIDSLDRRITTILQKIDFVQSDDERLKEVAPDLMKIVGATGMALIIGTELKTFGDTPDKDGIELIDDWFASQDSKQVVTHNCLSHPIPEAMEFKDVASGVMCIKSFLRNVKGDLRVFWFRPELTKAIKWAGKPEKTVNPEGSPIPISPRKSFETWTEVSQGTGAPWSNSDIMAAAKLKALVLRSALHGIM